MIAFMSAAAAVTAVAFITAVVIAMDNDNGNITAAVASTIARHHWHPH